MPDKRPPKETNQLAKYILDVTTGETEKIEPPIRPIKNVNAVALAKLGASKGGLARKEKLSPRRRKQIAKIAAEARWKKASKS